MLSNSPALDVGNNSLLLFFDQRGTALINGSVDYPRVSGIRPDIGAYEVQQADLIHAADFEGCPPVPV